MFSINILNCTTLWKTEATFYNLWTFNKFRLSFRFSSDRRLNNLQMINYSQQIVKQSNVWVRGRIFCWCYIFFILWAHIYCFWFCVYLLVKSLLPSPLFCLALQKTHLIQANSFNSGILNWQEAKQFITVCSYKNGIQMNEWMTSI